MTIRPSLPASLVLAMLASAAVSVNGAPAADECLASPKGAAPAGKHWYYSTNRAMKRKCWFLADVDTGRAAVKPSKQRSQVAAMTQDGSLSNDARAELVEAEQQQASAMPLANAQSDLSPNESTGAEPRVSVFAERWPSAADGILVQSVSQKPVVHQVVAADSSVPAAVGQNARASSLPFAAAIFGVVLSGGILMAFASRRRGQPPFEGC